MKINAVSYLILFLFMVLFWKPMLFILKFIIKGALYSALLYSINLVTSSAGITVGINLVSSAICGLLGFYGVLVSYLSCFLYSFKL